nr:unnamed protein product [Callosobruchus analis]
MDRPLSDKELLEIIESDEFWKEDESDNVEGLNDEQDIDKEDRRSACEGIFTFADQSDQEEENELEISDHDSDSEQEWEPPNNDEESDSESDTDKDVSEFGNLDDGCVFCGKDKTKWATDAPRLLVTDSVVEQIVVCTNAKIRSVQQRYGEFKKRTNSRSKFRPSFVDQTDTLEIQAFFGLLYFLGVFKSGHEDLRSLWATDGTGRDIFRCTMPLARFSFLLCCLRFDNEETRKERMKENKLAAISEVFDLFIRNCQEMFSPGEFLTVDEMLVPFRGRCGFRMYIPRKPAKYGIKVQVLADAKTHYLVNAEVYTGKNIKKTKSKFSHPTEVVLRLATPVARTNRNITSDDWYSSLELVNELKKLSFTFLDRKEFLRNLASSLCRPHMTTRMYNVKITRKLRSLTADILGVTLDAEATSYEPTTASKRKRCTFCPSKKDHKTSTACHNCKKPVCRQCAKNVCPDCV